MVFRFWCWYGSIQHCEMDSLGKQTDEAFSGLDLYFLKIGEDHMEKIRKYALAFRSHINRYAGNYALAQIETKRYAIIDYKFLVNDNEFIKQWTTFTEDFTNDTDFTVKCLGLAIHVYIREVLKQSKCEEIEKKLPLVRARVINLEPIIQLSEIKASSYGKCLSLRGTVRKASGIKIICSLLEFRCAVCQSTQIWKQNNGVYTPPDKCKNQGCRSAGNFEALYKSKHTKTIDWQSIVIQQTECEMARIPPTLECELSEDLVRSCAPGDDIIVSGVIKARHINDNKGKNKNSEFDLYLDVISIYNHNEKNSSDPYDRITFTPEDYFSVKQIHAQQNLFCYLVHSLCPNIYGHEIVKAGLLLALFRGSKTNTFRSESHVLLIGDPGLGKSQMLKECVQVSPTGVYVCGNASTTSGLTVTMVRESGGDYSLEAGVLMLADQGCCCIDEFDKMQSQHACLLEAMEQQSISIAKAGVVCSLPTLPTILAAANPAGGHYDKSKTISENLKIGSPMLSRFDLIFILLDQPDQYLDKYIIKHILSAHSNENKKHTLQLENFGESFNQKFNSLRERLKNHNDTKNYLSSTAFRKYIAYAQKYVNPKLSEDAKRVLKKSYVSLRQEFASGNCTSVTARQLHSLIRLTQARAKVELREEASEEDAKDVIEIMRYSLTAVFTNESGALDTTRSQLGTGMSHKNKVIKLLNVLQKKSEVESKSIFTLTEIREAGDAAGIPKEKFSNMLETLNIQGFLLNKGGNKYQLNSAYL
ncbi:DNA helicase MCM8-like isoform X2 [Cylas formicarius]|uniref:DNA helicase MCM8-like isoform X2 n=1 Tax=Cylas formicarius TaxID=197179 RepID=UPI00295881E3|nr:DNA helicase MCM8-like isoform X2 [Cylas formicarius]